jgi:hypothetical protein
MSDTKYNFYALTPIDDADIGVYESALDFVFAHENVRNVAVSGSYGAGKSSVLASYKKKHVDKKFLHISLAHFRSANGNDDTTNEDTKTSTDAVLEGKILNQLIHQISPDRIPRTNFRVKKETSNKRNIITTVLAALGVILGLYTFLFSQWTAFVQSLNIGFLKKFFWLSEQPESRLFAGLGFCVVVGVFAYRIVKLQESRHIIKRADVSGVEIEIFEDSNESYFDKYLNEVLYLFEKADAEVIVFEDIDRYDSNSIFERLHEINTLVNNGRKDKLLRFFYLMRDDIFVSKDRTKFFDFIIPIIPIVDGSNSFNKFIDCFQKSGLIGNGTAIIDLEFLQGLSLYIDDMRILQNICNEFLVYHGRLSTTEQDPNKMLALIAVKNLYPRDFADLQLMRGFMFEIIGGNGKDKLVASEKTALNSSIIAKTEELVTVQNELLFSDEIALLYHSKFYYLMQRSGYNRFSLTDNPQTCIQNIESNRVYLQHHKTILDEYDARMADSTKNDLEKATRISSLEAEIYQLKSRLVELTGLRLKDVITRSNIKYLFEAVFKSETGNTDNDFNEIKDSPYFDLLKFLVREGFIDETYSDYMTYFYENSLSRADKVFLRSVTDKKAKEPTYNLDNPQMVVSRLPVTYFGQEETLNYALFDFLLADFSSGRTFADKAIKLINQIVEDECFDFLLGYCENNLSSNLVMAFGAEWPSFFSRFFAKLNICDTPTEPKTKSEIFITRYAYTLLTLIGENPQRTSYLDAPSTERLVKYISNDANFLIPADCDEQNVALGIQQIGICFKAINAEAAQQTLLVLIYENDSYVINYGNIRTMLEAFYSDANLAALQTANYSVIMGKADSPLSKYINANINLYLDIVLAKCAGTITDTPDNAVLILNNLDVDNEKKNTYISYLKTTIDDILDIDDKNLWSALFENSIAIDYSALNVVAYFSAKCDDIFDDVLVKYINDKGTIVTFNDCFENDEERKKVFSAIVKSSSLNNHLYKGYLEQFAFYYQKFQIAGLPYEKIKILDELDKIRMSSESLVFMRENYEDYVYSFIAQHIGEYIKVVSETESFLLEETLVLLNTDIADADKIALLQLDETPISIKDKKYSDVVVSHILLNNYDTDDFSYILASYSNFGTQTKTIILENAKNQIQHVLSVLDSVNRQLLSALLLSDDVIVQNKQTIFMALASNADDSEVKHWLTYVNGSEFLALYDSSKRPRFENNEWNKSLLEIFKDRQLIKKYELSEQFGRFTISRWRTGSAKEKILD